MSFKSIFKKIVDEAFNYREALERENLQQSEVNLLKEKIQNSKHIPQLLFDKQLVIFLAACKGDVDKSVILLENYYTIKQSTHELFKNRIIDSEKIQNCLKNCYYFPLPITPSNNFIIYHALRNFDPNVYNFNEACKTLIMNAESCIVDNGPRSGMILLYDVTGITLRHCLQPSFKVMRNGFKFLEECLPLEITAVHIFNTNSFVNFILQMIKPFIRSDILNKTHLHNHDIDYEKFYKEHVPKSHLPSNYGGTLESIEELHEKHCKKFMKYRDYFFYEEKQALLDLGDCDEDLTDINEHDTQNKSL